MHKFRGFSREQLIGVYRNMATSRKMDEKMLTLLKQGKAYFHIGAAGHEAVQVAAAMQFKSGHDWFYPYYRDQAFCLQLGHSIANHFLAFLAKKDDPSSGGRQMPQHFGNAALRIVSQSSPTGTQFLQAVGCAKGIQLQGSQDVVYVSAGEGTTSQGDFHEALNWCSRERLGVIFHIEDNHFAISVPSHEQISGGSVYQMTQGYANLERWHVDGSDFFKSYKTFYKAIQRARAGEGPSIIVSDVVRLLPHSSSDDHRKYRSAEAIEEDKKRDPLPHFISACSLFGILTQKDFVELDEKIAQEIAQAVEMVERHADPAPSSALMHVFGPVPSISTRPNTVPQGEKIVMVDAINHALQEEMAVNEKIVIFGQDVADGKGGVFTVTRGLSTRFGKERVFNSPLAESSIIGVAVGLAVQGWHPVVEIQFGDYIWTAMMQLRNELTAMRYRSNGAFHCPVVVRVPVGGYIHGGLCHSQSIEAYFTHMSGIYVFYPSTAADAKGLLKYAMRLQDPVLFLEHKGLYRHAYSAGPEPDEFQLLAMGQARQVLQGSDLTIITWGMMVKHTMDAIRQLNLPENSVDLLDLRTLCPLDWQAIERSVKKTGKVLIVHEENLTGGFGAEISALIAERLFTELDAPILRIGAKDTQIPYHPALENQILPQIQDIADALHTLHSF